MKKWKCITIIPILIFTLAISSFPAYAASIDYSQTQQIPLLSAEDFQKSRSSECTTIFSTDDDRNILQFNPNLSMNQNDIYKINSIKAIAVPNDELGNREDDITDEELSSISLPITDEKMSVEEAQEFGQSLLNLASFTKRRIESDNTSLKDSTSTSIRASTAGLPDIYLHDYTITAPYEKYPFPTHKDTQIYFKIENIGTATATLIYLDFYVNDIKINVDRSYLLPELEAGYYYEWEMPFKWTAGTNTVKFTVNQTRVMGELDYSNNTVSLTYKWKDYTDLYMDTFDTVDGLKNFHAMETKEFVSDIKNAGKSGANSFDISVKDKSGYKCFIATASLLPNYHLETSIDITVFKKTSNAYFDLIIDYNDDYDKKNNTQRSSTYQIEYALEPNGLKWKYSQISDLTVGVSPSALQFLREYGLSDSDIIVCLQKWNNVSAKNHSIHITAMLSSAEFPDTDIYITTGSLSSTNETARTVLSDGGDYFVSGQVYTILNTNSSRWLTHTSIQRKATLIHEMGHALGLGHSYCLDNSIMTEYSDSTYRSTSITAHDEYNLKYLYGNL